MRHAYLIIAHNEFEVLQQLIESLDDVRNDIFIHIDKKVLFIPQLLANQAKIIYLYDRLDVRWGSISQIEVEYLLFEKAYHNDENYDYYHLISGVHLPLYNQDYLHRYFKKHEGKQHLSPMAISSYQIDLKMRRYNFFLNSFTSPNNIVKIIAQFCWRLAHFIQKKLNISRWRKEEFYNASNWVSITNDAVAFLLKRKKAILSKYRFSFCGDEFFIPTELQVSKLKDSIFYNDRLLLHEVNRSNAETFNIDDFEKLRSSNCLFARKFTNNDFSIIYKVKQMTINRVN